MNVKNSLARKIVAELFWRERFCKHLLNKALRGEIKVPRPDVYVATSTAHWAEAHNAAVTAKKILMGIDIE